MSGLKSKIDKLRHPTKLTTPLGALRLLDWMPDDIYVVLAFRGRMGYWLNLRKPITFNEKLQWLKVYDRKEVYTDFVDKLKAKEKVGALIGYEYIVPLYGSWNNVNDIPFDELPTSFVMKCNHDQGSVTIVTDKNKLDINNLQERYERLICRNIYYGTREYAYKNIEPKVFAEAYLGDNIIDYKFYCFNGEPKFLYCGQGLTQDHSLKIDFFDLNWNLMPFYRTDYDRLGKIPKPDHFEEMIEIAKKLSFGVPFVRIDLFEVERQVYFSEFTLCPASGFMPFVPKEYDQIVGEWLKLPEG